MRWRNLLYFDKFFPMGLRSVAYCCQRVTNAIAFTHHDLGYWSLNYLDDFGSAEPAHVAWSLYWCLGEILKRIGVQEAEQKACAPSPRMEFLGNIFDVIKMIIEILGDRLIKINNELETWLLMESSTRKQLESLIGKLSFISNCVCAGRVFISRMINALSGFPRFGKRPVGLEVRKDIL